MKQILLLCLSWLLLLQFATAQVIFFEDFQQGIPASFTLINNDNKTPASQVSVVNNAWVAYEWNTQTHDTAAISTSWYSPAAQADDWMITSPILLSAKATLSWKAVALDPDFRDGYEVRISTSGKNIGDFTTVLFSTNAEQTILTNHSADLQAYTGQTVYLAFRNNSYNKNLLLVDDIKIELKPPFDAAILSSVSPSRYTIIPRSQRNAFQPSAVVYNNGANNLTNVKLFCAVRRNSVLQKIDSGTVSFLGSGLVSTFNFPLFTPIDTGLFELNYFTQIQQTDGDKTNDTLKHFLLVNDTVYARDNGSINGNMSIGANYGEFGSFYEIFHPAKANSATVYLTKPSVGATVKFKLYVFGNSPQGIVDSTFSYTTTLSDSLNGKLLTLNFIAKTKMQIGKYLLAIVEQNGAKLNVGICDAIQTNSANWFKFSGNPFYRWASGNEYDSLLATQAFTRVLAMRLNIENACTVQPNFGIVNRPTCTNDGALTSNYSSENPSPYKFIWSTNDSTKTISNLLPGVYSITVTDNFKCQFSHSDTIKSVPIKVAMSVKDVGCKGGNNGAATANSSGGNGNYTYSWNTSPSQSSKTATGLAQGIYTVTVSDGSCSTTALAPVEQPSTLMKVDVVAKVNPSSPQAQDGIITVNASNGTPPYQYVWSDSIVQPQLSGIGAGNYCVTVTDARDCQIEKCDTIGFGVGINEVLINNFNIYPNPANDFVTIENNTQPPFYFLLWNNAGKLVSKIRVERNTVLDIREFAAGIYIAEIKTSTATERKKIIIAH